jgi:anaerobic selenocysteine-containing dehydrogenase
MADILRTTCTRDCPDACGIVATVEDGRVTALAGDKAHPVTRGFLCERTGKFLHLQYHPQRLTQPLVRQDGELVPVTWDAALDHVAQTLRRIRDESGPEAVLHYRSGGSLGVLKTVNDWFFECFGGARVKRGDICSGAGEAAQEADLGISESHALEDLLHSRIIVLWGKNVVTSFVHMMPVLKEARAGGTYVVLIDPVPNKTERFADLVLRPRPGADRFLALGVARAILDADATDPTLPEWSVGAPEFARLARARTAAEWAAAADVPPEELLRFASEYAARRPGNIQVGWGLQRRLQGSVTIRAIDALAALVGNYGVPGSGVTFYYRRRAAFDLDRWRAPAGRRSLLEPRLGHEILAAQDPPVRAVVIDNANPVAMLPDSHSVVEALRSRELTVVLEQQMTDTALHAHVVLPVTTMLEERDLVAAYGHHYLSASNPVVLPPAGVRSDLEVYQGLAQRLGFGDRLAGSADEWAQRFLVRVQGQVELETLRRGVVRNPLAARVLFAGKKFATADARYHFVTDIDLTQESDPGYPLQLGSFSTPRAQASQWSSEWDGQPFEVRCHPDAAPGCTDGAAADLVSRLGRMRVRVRLDAGLRRDLVVLPKGGWLQHGTAANALVRARLTDAGEGAAYYDEAVRLEPVD